MAPVATPPRLIEAVIVELKVISAAFAEARAPKRAPLIVAATAFRVRDISASFMATDEMKSAVTVTFRSAQAAVTAAIETPRVPSTMIDPWTGSGRLLKTLIAKVRPSTSGLSATEMNLPTVADAESKAERSRSSEPLIPARFCCAVSAAVPWALLVVSKKFWTSSALVLSSEMNAVADSCPKRILAA